jgi:DNA recombination protein RmuC
MVYALCVLAGLVVGGAVGWFLATLRRNAAPAEAERQAGAAEGQVAILREQVEKAAADFEKLRAELGAEREARARAETECQGTLLRLQDEKKLLDDARGAFENTFKALSSEVLSASNRDFLQLARKSMDEILATAKGDLDKRQESISGLVKPLADSLKRYEDEVRALERHRQEAYSGLSEQVKLLASGQQQLQKETGNLVTALRKPQVRGRWGEITLERVVELSGMSDHCDFTQQVSVDSDEGRKRPDMIVHLPQGRLIVVDSKVSLEAYLTAVESRNEEERAVQLTHHARQVRAHMMSLSNKAYWDQFASAPEFVVMFIPGEPFFAAAVDYDRTLIEDGMERRVIIATPTTLIALLRAVAYGWRQEKIAENAQEISNLGRQLYDRMRVLAEHIGDIGEHLGKSTDAYNRAVGSMEHMVFPAARRFKELGAVSSDDIPAIEPVETQARKPATPEVTGEF